MKTLLLSILVSGFWFLGTGLAQTPAPKPVLQIYVSADHSFRGPFTHAPAALSGEAVVTLTAAQFAALNAVRSANPMAHHFAFDGTTFTVAPAEQLRIGLLSAFAGLTPAEQALFKPTGDAALSRLARGDIAGVQEIITLSGAGMPQTIANVRSTMLALITTLYGANPPSVN